MKKRFIKETTILGVPVKAEIEVVEKYDRSIEELRTAIYNLKLIINSAILRHWRFLIAVYLTVIVVAILFAR